ncbi:hypothetical protein CLOSTMETH_01381 [[Clostridium] methylpentosum DSM 5476]|uniref:Uncharacterized protein n=1 Tax=[Clostridium] methylpentosum DSM 5476 TaxID=537013 RepID=C0EC12_9FIRM|nr:hypothetical protein CLOSTMETH_01381 [[Clostridium] methylpentosum DSM 5476]
MQFFWISLAFIIPYAAIFVYLQNGNGAFVWCRKRHSQIGWSAELTFQERVISHFPRTLWAITLEASGDMRPEYLIFLSK